MGVCIVTVDIFGGQNLLKARNVLLAGAALLAMATPAVADQYGYHYNGNLSENGSGYAKTVWVSATIPGDAKAYRGDFYVVAISGINNYPISVGVHENPGITPSNCFYGWYSSSGVFTWDGTYDYRSNINPNKSPGDDMNYVISNHSVTGGADSTVWHVTWNSFDHHIDSPNFDTGTTRTPRAYLYVNGLGCNATTTNSTSYRFWGAEYQDAAANWHWWSTTTASGSGSGCSTSWHSSGDAGSNGSAYIGVY